MIGHNILQERYHQLSEALRRQKDAIDVQLRTIERHREYLEALVTEYGGLSMALAETEVQLHNSN